MPTYPQAEPAWLIAKIDQRLALMTDVIEQRIGLGMLSEFAGDKALVMAQLSEPDENATQEERDRWEYTCDNCGAYCPYPVPFYTGHAMRTIGPAQVLIAFGACQRCKELSD
jgi:hypothetical protein